LNFAKVGSWNMGASNRWIPAVLLIGLLAAAGIILSGCPNSDTGGGPTPRKDGPAPAPIPVPPPAPQAPPSQAKGKGPMSEPRTPQLPDPSIEAAVDELARLKPGPETEKAIAALAAKGPAAVEEIGRQLAERDPDFVRTHNAVRVLKAINDAPSRDLLGRIAMGQLTDGNQALEAWAAQALIAASPPEAWKLLPAASPPVLTVALNAVKGQAIDAGRLAVLVPCLKNPDGLVRALAARTMAAAPEGKLARDAAEAISAALAAVASLPDAKNTEPVPDRFGIALTPSERSYADYMLALKDLRVDNKTLDETTRGLTGRARDSVIVALGRRGDPAVRPDLIKMAQDTAAGMFRVWAIDALAKVGTPGDLPALKRFADDPFTRNAPVAPGVHGQRYLVREAAKAAMTAIEKKK
jgi:HEAT repeat protein